MDKWRKRDKSCPKCQEKYHRKNPHSIHHIKPKRHGGRHGDTISICRHCHDRLERFIPFKIQPHWVYYSILEVFLAGYFDKEERWKIWWGSVPCVASFTASENGSGLAICNGSNKRKCAGCLSLTESIGHSRSAQIVLSNATINSNTKTSRLLVKRAN